MTNLPQGVGALMLIASNYQQTAQLVETAGYGEEIDTSAALKPFGDAVELIVNRHLKEVKVQWASKAAKKRSWKNDHSLVEFSYNNIRFVARVDLLKARGLQEKVKEKMNAQAVIPLTSESMLFDNCSFEQAVRLYWSILRWAETVEVKDEGSGLFRAGAFTFIKTPSQAKEYCLYMASWGHHDNGLVARHVNCEGTPNEIFVLLLQELMMNELYMLGHTGYEGPFNIFARDWTKNGSHQGKEAVTGFANAKDAAIRLAELVRGLEHGNAVVYAWFVCVYGEFVLPPYHTNYFLPYEDKKIFATEEELNAALERRATIAEGIKLAIQTIRKVAAQRRFEVFYHADGAFEVSLQVGEPLTHGGYRLDDKALLKHYESGVLQDWAAWVQENWSDEAVAAKQAKAALLFDFIVTKARGRGFDLTPLGDYHNRAIPLDAVETGRRLTHRFKNTLWYVLEKDGKLKIGSISETMYYGRLTLGGQITYDADSARFFTHIDFLIEWADALGWQAEAS